MARLSTKEELTAADAIAARLGIGPVQPLLVKLARHTTVRLAPRPLIARVQSAVSTGQAVANLAGELSVARYLASRGAPAIRPATGVDPGPHVEGGCVLTLWKHMPHQAVESEADIRLAAMALRQFHAAFEPFIGPLPRFTAAIDACKDLLAVPTRTPTLDGSSRAFLCRLHDQLRAELGRRDWTPVPLHGDAHPGNVLLTEAGAIWADLEAACRGPQEWDIASLPEPTWSEFDGIDLKLTRCLADLRSLCVAAWCWADHGRNAEIDEAAEHHLNDLKTRVG